MLRDTFNKIFNNKVDALGLSVFRILYSIVLFCETSQLFRFRHVIYDKEALGYVGEVDVSFIFFFWFVVLVFLLLGFHTRLSSILNYIFAVIIFSSAKYYSYHVYYVYVAVNFLLMFIPISRVFSIDSLRRKIKYSRVGYVYREDRKVLEINYLIIVFSAIALVYFDSVFQKLISPMWLSGLGMWLPSSLPMVTWNDTSILLNQEWLMKFLGYFVILFEAVFIFLFWFRSLRIPLMLIGILFHIGIFIIYPIPWFALTLIAVYLLMLPEYFWSKLSALFKRNKAPYTFYYDAACPLCIKVIVAIKHFDVFNRIRCKTVQESASAEPALKNVTEEELLINIHGVGKNGKVYKGYDAYSKLFQELIFTYPIALLMNFPGIVIVGKKMYRFIAGERLTTRCTEENCNIPVFSLPPSEHQAILIKNWNRINSTKFFWKTLMIFMFIAQCMMIWASPMIQRKINPKRRLNKIHHFMFEKSEFYLKNYMGIYYHGVFLNDHFDKNNFIFRITYLDKNNQEKELPFVNYNGMPEYFNYGPMWCYNTYHMSFDMMHQRNDKALFEKGIINYLKYYRSEHRIKTQQLDFMIYVKEIETSKKWQKDFLKNQINKPWRMVGKTVLINEAAVFDWSSSAELIFNTRN